MDRSVYPFICCDDNVKVNPAVGSLHSLRRGAGGWWEWGGLTLAELLQEGEGLRVLNCRLRFGAVSKVHILIISQWRDSLC